MVNAKQCFTLTSQEEFSIYLLITVLFAQVRVKRLLYTLTKDRKKAFN